MQRFKNILLVLGDTRVEAPSFQRAVDIAKKNDAVLRIIDVVPATPITRSLRSFSEKMYSIHKQAVAERKLEMEQTLYGCLEDLEATIDVLSGKPFVEIIRYVQLHDCDLVIKSVEEEKLFSSMLMGSTDMKLLRKCPCPVWIGKADDHGGSRKILAAVELESVDDVMEELNRQIVEMATSLAHQESAELHIVNAYVIFAGDALARKLSKHYEEDAEEWVEQQKAAISASQRSFTENVRDHLSARNMDDLRCIFHFEEGDPEKVIVDLAKKEAVDLVVMGTVGRSDLAGFIIGNTSEAVFHQLTCSVLAVKPMGFHSPVTLKAD